MVVVGLLLPLLQLARVIAAAMRISPRMGFMLFLFRFKAVMHYERLGRAKRFTGAAVERRVVATKQPLGLENYQSVSSP